LDIHHLTNTLSAALPSTLSGGYAYLAMFLPLCIYLIVLALHLLIPARLVDGYIINPDTGRPLRYRLNGLRVFAIMLVLYFGLCHMGWISPTIFYTYRWECAIGACIIGLVFTAAIVFSAPPNKGLLADFYLGRWENPQWRGIDAKMYLYLVGAVMLALNVLSFAAYHAETYADDPSPGVALYACLFLFFLTEYLNFEEVHLYTYDFMAERVGFKLGWGCLVFYPFFYPIGLWTIAPRANPHTPAPLLVLSALLFFSGWVLSRGANLQKFYFKKNPFAKAFGVLEPRALNHGDRYILTGGFWGLSRHINYLGEILMATGLALSLGYPGALGPWLYPLYYMALLIPRQLDDDRRCAEKYGPLWEEYRQRVPYRIIPWVY
jgi:protein-S-isoprenylcysteine O-methyltransferase Ste14